MAQTYTLYVRGESPLGEIDIQHRFTAGDFYASRLPDGTASAKFDARGTLIAAAGSRRDAANGRTYTTLWAIRADRQAQR